MINNLLPLVVFISSFAQTEFEGQISGEWDVDGSPYLQVGAANVPRGESLSINPGVQIILGEGLTFFVNGQILAEGSEEASIRFRNDEGTIPPGIHLNENDEVTSNFSYCSFDSLDIGLESFGHSLMIEDCRFKYCGKSTDLRLGSIVMTRCSFTTDDFEERGKVDFGNTRFFGGEYEITDNDFTGLDQVNVKSSPDVVISNNVGHGLKIWESRNVLIGENSIDRIYTRNCQGPFVIEENTAVSIGLSRGGLYEIRNNSVSDLLSVFQAQFEAENNNLKIISMSRATQGLIVNNTLERMQFRDFMATPRATLINNTFYYKLRRDDLNASFIPADGIITELTNNIFTSNYLCGYGVFASPVLSGGYNCFHNIQTSYSSEELFEGDIETNPLLRDGRDNDLRLQAISPCIDAGDPDADDDPDGTRSDMGAFYFDHDNGMPPTITSELHKNTGWGMDFSYTVIANDEGDELAFDFEGLPEWLEPVERDLVSDTLVLAGEVPRDQESFNFIITATDEDEEEDTLTVSVTVAPSLVLTGQINGTLTQERSPYVIIDTAFVAEDDSLIIEPGCEILFYWGEDEGGEIRPFLNVEGFIQAVGTEEDSILFLPFEEGIGYHRVTLYGDHETVMEFKYCRFNQGSILSYGQDMTVTNSLFTNRGGVSARDYPEHVIVEDCVFLDAGVGIRGSGRLSNNYIRSTGLFRSIHSMSGDSLAIFNNHILNADIGLYSSQDPANLYIYNNLIEDCEVGIQINLQRSSARIHHNVINNCGRGYYSLSNAPDTLAYNIISNSTEAGIYLYSTFMAVHNNVITGGPTGAIFNRGVQITDFFNNIIYDVEELYSSVEIIGFPDMRHNLHYNFQSIGIELNNFLEITRVNTNGDSTDRYFNMILDPEFLGIEPVQYHLTESSPAINAGNPDGERDRDGTIPDIGPFAYNHDNHPPRIIETTPPEGRVFVNHEAVAHFNIQAEDEDEDELYFIYKLAVPTGEDTMWTIISRLFEFDYTFPQGMQRQYRIISMITDGQIFDTLGWDVWLTRLGIEDHDLLPTEFTLYEPYPNPFNSQIRIDFFVPRSNDVKAEIYDLTGREVYKFDSQNYTPGFHTLSWNGKNHNDQNLSAGLYILEIKYEDKTLNKKCVMIK